MTHSIAMCTARRPCWGCCICTCVHQTVTGDGNSRGVRHTVCALCLQREALAVDAAQARVLEALLASTAAHKSAAAVGAGASCLLAACLAAPSLREKLGQLPGRCCQLVWFVAQHRIWHVAVHSRCLLHRTGLMSQTQRLWLRSRHAAQQCRLTHRDF